MRIAIFAETFLPKQDGITTTLCYFLDYLAAHHHASLMFAPEGAPEFYADTPIIGVPSLAFPLYPELRLGLPIANLKEELAAFCPDVVQVVNPVVLGLAGMQHARALGAPVVASYHTDIPGYTVKYGVGLLQDPAWAYFRWVHNQADLTLCPSKFTQAQLQRQGFQRVKLWGRGVDTLRFNPRHRSEHWRRRLTGGYPQAPLLLYVGRLAVEKRVEWLRAVLQALPQARLAIVGDGPQRHQLEEIFSGTNTVFTGYLRGQDLAQAYASADVFVFPSANETLGNVILEAMASGLPIIAPSSGGQVDHVVDGWNGHLFDPNSPAHLSALAQRLVADPRHAHRLGMAARIYAESHGWQAVFDGLLNDYASLAKPCLPTGYYLDEIAAPTFQTY